ncbi:citron rho-interacting kinase-like isoform X1 [Penaeus japonicus]|uniref:citron rho-interacting kinase-like isoform X1 n=1 Tax=Penaeus japonicus TaxID=27405 RepID=UPI001C70CCC2|nr:citron rho-interacting kinase-like isoform X1 [Penaeus japonicus]XP_042883994.1 citron rho-interacting kinase-like isoform X1 [Penaeus japonicus]
MAEPKLEPIVKRIRHLSSLVSTSGLDGGKGSGFVTPQLVGHEGLLDALFVLYDECNNDQMKKDVNVCAFIDKYRSTVHDLRKLRVNLNDFEQKKVIGKGHFGVVQVVREKATGNVFALKSLRKSDTLSQQHVAFYEEERDIMAKATSTWITKLQYAFQDDQQLYLVMEFHPGGDLLSLLDRYDGTFSEDMARFYLAEITLAIHDLHSMGYVHRDIKPDNILIDRCGHVKLADFGSAAKLTSSGVVRSKMPVGTPDYIAPEVLQSLNEKASGVSYGVECDLWSLGIMAYEMCFGDTPFKGEKVVDTYSNIMNHKKKLKFDDEDNVVSEGAKDLIRGLLEEANHRLNHSAIVQHKFFLLVNWNDLQNCPPPFVPIVNSVDDTSNFEEFENERRLPNVDAFRTRQGFSGRNLPFVGFTYNRGKTNGEGSSPAPGVRTTSIGSSIVNVSLLDETFRESSQRDEQVKALKKENHELKLQVENLRDKEHGREVQARDRKLKEAECRIEYLEKERQRLEEENVRCERAAATYKRDLALERSNRVQTETQTIELVRGMKNKWKQEEAKKLEALSSKIAAYEEEIAFQQSQHKEIVNALAEREKEFKVFAAETQKLKKQLHAKEKMEISFQKEKAEMVCDGDCSPAQEAKQKLEELIQKLEKETEKREKIATKLEAEASLRNELEKELHQKAHVEDESKLMENQLEELNQKLSETERALEAAEKRMKHVEQQNHAAKKQRIDELECQLTQEKKECSILRNQLQELTGRLNESRASYESLDSTRSLREEEQEAKIKELEQELKFATSGKLDLQNQLAVVRAREGEHKSKISELELLLSKLDDTVRSLENKKSSTEACEETFQAKLQLLETQLESAKAASEQDKEKCKKLSEDLRVAKAELSDCKLDLRVAQRDAKSSQDTISYLRERSREQRTQLEEKETAIKKVKELEEELRKNMEKQEAEIQKQEAEFEKERAAHKKSVAALEERIKNLQEINKGSEELQKKLRDAYQQADSLKLEKRGLESQIKMVESAREEIKQEKQNMRSEADDLRKKLQDSEATITQLKELCSMQDEELTVMESLSEQIKTHQEEKDKLQENIEKLQTDLRTARSSVNEEKSLKLFQERKVKDLESQLNCRDEESDQQVARLNEQLQESNKSSLELHEQIEGLEKELKEATLLVRNMEREFTSLQGQRDLMQHEIDGHIHHIHTLKESNFKLTEALETAVSKGEVFKQKIEEVERLLSDQQVMFEDEKIKMKSTIEQQTKLIDFLQAKTDNSKKKKNFKEKLFGGKDKENTGFSMPHQYRELEDLLARERMNGKQIQDQLIKARAEIVALRANGGTLDNKSVMGTPRPPRTPMVSRTPLQIKTPQNKRALEHIVDSPNMQESSSKQRMRHNIPHRWQSGLQMRAIRCAGCLDSIPFARNASKCQECGIIAHNKCCMELPSTCGLPVQFAEHYARGWSSDSPVKSHGSQSSQKCVIQGLLKMPKSGKACWESRFVSLEQEEILIYDHEPSSGMQPRSKISLSRPGCITTVMSAVPRSELPNTSSVDLPYVLKIEIRAKTASGHSDTLYFMTTNFEEKQSWVSALEGVLAQFNDNTTCAYIFSPDERLNKGEVEDSSLTACIQENTLLSLDSPNPLDINIIVYLNKTTALVGATEGLYSFEMDQSGKLRSRARIEGLSSIHQILMLEEAGMVLFIAGKENLVYMNDMRTVISAAEAAQLSKPSLSMQRVEPLQGCHLLASGCTSAKQTFMCAAASDRISILVWNDLKNEFNVCRQYSTQEPCSCLHFTKASLIVGAEKFYEIDLKTFDIEEFLDESDTSLAYAIYGSTQMSSYPVAILQVSKPGKYEEYLLCFYEFAVFVDPCGQRSREHDIKFTRLPIAIVFRNPYLYIIHQNAVEVIEIRPDSFTRVTNIDTDTDSDIGPPIRMVTKNMARPSYLGPALNEESITIASRSSDKLQVMQITASFPEDLDMSSTWGTLPSFSMHKEEADTVSVNSVSSRGSITSSESDIGYSNKRVQFTATAQTPSSKRSKTGL